MSTKGSIAGSKPGSKAGSKAGSKPGTPHSSKASTPKGGSKAATPLPVENENSNNVTDGTEQDPAAGSVAGKVFFITLQII